MLLSDFKLFLDVSTPPFSLWESPGFAPAAANPCHPDDRAVVTGLG